MGGGGVLHSVHSQRCCVYYIVLIKSHEDILGHTAIGRKVVEKMCTRQSWKVIWNMINTLFLTTVAVEPTFVAFLQPSQTYVPGLPCHSFQLFWRTVHSKSPTIPFGIVVCTVSDNLSRNSCISSHTALDIIKIEQKCTRFFWLPLARSIQRFRSVQAEKYSIQNKPDVSAKTGTWFSSKWIRQISKSPACFLLTCQVSEKSFLCPSSHEVLT